MQPHAELADLVLQLPQPLGFGGQAATKEDAAAIAQTLKVKVYRLPGEGDGAAKIQFHNVLSAVAGALKRRKGQPVEIIPAKRGKRRSATITSSPEDVLRLVSANSAKAKEMV